MKQVEVTIMGQGYILGCPEGGETLLETAVAAVDQEMSTIRDAGRIKARERIAVLAALNLAYRLADRTVPAAPPAQAPSSSSGTPAGETGGKDLEALIQRIDRALGEDGLLL